MRAELLIGSKEVENRIYFPGLPVRINKNAHVRVYKLRGSENGIGI